MKGWSAEHGSLDFLTIRRLYASRQLTPIALVDILLRRLSRVPEENVFVTVVERDTLLAAARTLETRPRGATGETAAPLWGIPFAVKDNIDVAGMPTTAGCRDFAHVPAHSAPVVERLVAAGALLVGKTNMDQFATGLTGILSSYGPCRNPFNPAYISGGSSSGSAVAVARGLVSFALGTDTAGSGRVPASFCNVVGLKPSRGLVSTRGILPACRSLDCPSVFGLTVPDAAEVLDVVKGYDRDDICSQRRADELDLGCLPLPLNSFRFGVPGKAHLDLQGDDGAATLYEQALARLEHLGGRRVEIDFGPFAEAARLLYQGPWLAERLAGLEDFLAAHGESVHPVTRGIISSAAGIRAVEAFKAMYRIEGLKRVAAEQWSLMDVLVLPTTPTIPTMEEVLRDPASASATLGRYTNFVNLLDLCALALPAGFRANGLPSGITLVAPAMRDARIVHLGTRYHAALGGTLGATGESVSAALREELRDDTPCPTREEPRMRLCVVGAHLSGMPLNHQLTVLGGTLALRCRTAPLYRLYALHGTIPPKPGLVRQSADDAARPVRGIEVEVWEVPRNQVGCFLSKVLAPLCIGTITLETGETVAGFLCEGYAVAEATDITAYGGWRAYMASRHEAREPAESGSA